MSTRQQLPKGRSRSPKSVQGAANKRPVRKSQDPWQELFECLPDAIFVHDLHGKVLDANPAACRLHGCPRERLVCENVLDLAAPDYRRQLERELHTLARAQRSAAGEYRWISTEGAVPVEVRLGRIEWAGKPALLLHVRDLRERARLEEELRRNATRDRAMGEQQALLENIISHIPGAVFWKDRQGVYLGCNENSARDLGKTSQAEIIGLTDFDMPFSREEAEFYRKCDREVMESGQPLLQIEETQHRPDGSAAVLLTSKVPLRDDLGRVIGVLGVYADITERKRAEQLLEQRERLFRAVIEAAGAVPYTRNYATDQFDYIGPGIEGLLGYAPGDFTTRHLGVRWRRKCSCPAKLRECRPPRRR